MSTYLHTGTCACLSIAYLSMNSSMENNINIQTYMSIPSRVFGAKISIVIHIFKQYNQFPLGTFHLELQVQASNPHVYISIYKGISFAFL